MNKKKIVKNLFDDISNRYDLLNRILSFGIDIYWRKKALKLSELSENDTILDLACGTGDFSIEIEKKGIKKIFGADLSKKMLDLFQKKSEWIKGKIVQCEAEYLPFKNSSFDAVISAFGVRNFHDLISSIKEIKRALKKGGKLVILDFQLPEKKIFAKIYMFYFEKVLPFIGGLISKNFDAYKYLPDSTKEFHKIDLQGILIKEGFSFVNKRQLTFGIVQIIVACK